MGPQCAHGAGIKHRNVHASADTGPHKLGMMFFWLGPATRPSPELCVEKLL